ncbi:MAG: exonuclease subunit SbcD [Bacteroidales bacterium]|nr:exonuclease subunit SbcD [Bacteroidales bacterium]
MLRIFHTADWHLGQSFFGYDRKLEHQHFLSWLKKRLFEKEVDVLLISGDVFDVSNPSAIAQRMFYEFLSEAINDNPSLQIVIIAGNHDSASRLEVPQPLLDKGKVIIKGLIPKKEGLIDYDSLIIDLKNKRGEVEALCLAVPFLRQGDYPSVPHAENAYSAGVQAFYTEIIDVAKTRKEVNQALVIMGHLHTLKAEVADKDHSERIIIGGLEEISPEIFTDDVAYTALGHIHKAQCVAGSEKIRYAGSPLPLSFAEKNYKKGVVEVTIDAGKLVSVERIAYEPLIQLMSIPKQGSASPDSILKELKNLPSATNQLDYYPYLEINVLLTEPEPLLKSKIEEVLEQKAVRLARIQSHFENKNETEELMETELLGLDNKSPIDVANLYYQSKYGVDMPDELRSLFHEACSLVEIKEK